MTCFEDSSYSGTYLDSFPKYQIHIGFYPYLTTQKTQNHLNGTDAPK